MPFIGMLDYVFRTYHWTYYDWLAHPFWLWEELQMFWDGRAFVQRMKKSAPEADNTTDLIALAKAQGFDTDPTWEGELADNP